MGFYGGREVRLDFVVIGWVASGYSGWQDLTMHETR